MIFFVFAVVFFIIMVVFIVCRCCATDLEEDTMRERVQRKPPVAVMLQHGDAPLLLRQESHERSLPRGEPSASQRQRAFASQSPYHSPPRHTQLTIDRSPDSFDSIPEGLSPQRNAHTSLHSSVSPRDRSVPRTEVRDPPKGDYHPDLML